MQALAHDTTFDPDLSLCRRVFSGNGYHSKLKDGTPVHDTRLSAEYALECLHCGSADRVARAAAILERLSALQDTNPISKTYGIWSYTYEESLAQMDPPDWNWADFIGVRFAQAIRLHADALPPATLDQCRTTLGHAAWSIFRRNVDAGYTNIAIMGAVVAAAAGELLDQPLLLDFARRRFRAVQDLVATNGSFNEYNSPTYTVVAIEELDRLALLVRDPECNARANALWHHAWKVVAEHFHAPTAQWAGPHARAYSDLLGPGTVEWLSAATGLDIPCAQGRVANRTPSVPHPPRRCPEEFLPAFTRTPTEGSLLERQFCVMDGFPIIGTTWMDRNLCLASVNRDNTWVQRRFLLGYWNVAGGVAVLKMSVLLNGREFPGFRVMQQQKETRILSALSPMFGTGYYHPTLNTVPDGHFEVTDLRIQYSLRAPDAQIRQLPDGRFVLSAGTWHAILTPADCTFNGLPIRWNAGTTEGRVHVDGVIHAGSVQMMDFKAASMCAAMGIELTTQSEPVALASVRKDVDAGVLKADWNGLHVQIPVQATRFEW